MRITRVRYGRLVSGPGFENQRVEVEVEVGLGEIVSNAMDYARKFVDDQLGHRNEPSEYEVGQAVANKLREVASKVEDETLPF